MKKGSRVEHTSRSPASAARTASSRSSRSCSAARTIRRGRSRRLRVHPPHQGACTPSARSSSTSTARRRSAIARRCATRAGAAPARAAAATARPGPRCPRRPRSGRSRSWVSWVCHQDAPWLTPRIRQRVNDFARVLACRFPTVQDDRTPRLGQDAAPVLARWRYTSGMYGRPIELALGQRLLRVHDPRSESL